ncbi:MAG TPA: NAD(P)/FAD-dependent oxidoreductase [Acidimicrobiales bacterium]|jgi:NADH dehydrogenase|nr:NAD(P)/FAD-dependent oxidoreductase [Acidimicrobiales bacterium]
MTTPEINTRPRPRVVIVGAGFGGTNVTRELMDGPFEITLIDRDNYHGFWPLLYQVATAGLGPEDIAHPVRGMFGDRANVHVRLGTVSGVDLDRRLVHIEDEDDVEYDYLVLAAGSSTSDFGIPGVDEFAFPLKTLPDAVRLRNHILNSFERADACPELMDDGLLTFVLAGGGPTGVEMAGALSELIGQNLARDFPHLDVTKARVVLVEMLDHLLGGFSPQSQAEALRTLQAKGVEVRLNTAIAGVAEDEVTFKDGSSVRCRTVVWTAGIRANPLADRLDVAKGKGGAIEVTSHLTLEGHPEVFVIGDLASCQDRHGKPHPQVAQVAIQGARHVARCIRGHVLGRPYKDFRYHNHGMMATIGRRSAVAEIPGGLKLRGTFGWVSWLAVHIVFLVGFRNRVVVLINWAWNYISWERASRVILDDNTTTPSGHHRA